jgi:hypothetical protein
MPLQEANDSISPNSAGFSAEGGRAEWTYYCRGDQVEDECLDLLGWVQPKGDGRLTRDMPRVHPQYPWMIATAVNLRGQATQGTWPDDSGQPATVTAGWQATDADMTNLPAATAEYMRYVTYELRATFEAPVYALYPDAEITMDSGSWRDDTNVNKTFTFAREDKRYVDWPRFPAHEFLQYRHGQMVFRMATTAAPDKFPFGAQQRMPMRKKMLKAMWYRVPESYVTHPDSYLDRFLWRVNQKAISWGGEDYEPGELLYTGYGFPKRNVQPFPDPDPLYPGFYTTAKILDIEMTFLVCRWFDPAAPTPANENFIARGHNLDFSAYDRKPHYVTTLPLTSGTPPAPDTDATKWIPKYFSAPLELLFTDPAFTQDLGVLSQ